MKPIDPAEVSALLDGELSPERTEQVRRAIAEDSELRCVFESLSAVHRDLTSCAVAARFRPQISLARRRFPAVGVLVFAAAMLALRVTAKLVPLGVGVVLQVAALALVLWWVSSCLVRLAHDERWRFVAAEAPNIA
jgi:anti-sigma factor RsiW